MLANMPAHSHHFLLIDDNADNRFILMRAMTKSFPDALLEERWGTDAALESGSNPLVDAIIVHRTTEMTGVYFIQWLRKANPTVPIMMVSGIDRTHAALAAGANRFLLIDDWKELGATIAQLLQERQKAVPVEAPAA
jgi:DNA-binding response OmpR family regulator